MGAIGDVFGGLFGTKKAVDNILDKDKGLLTQFGGWVNDLSYTDAERAKNVIITREWGIKQLDALSPFKVVQRILAFSATFLWVFIGLNVVIGLWVEAFTGVVIVKSLLEFALSNYVLYPTLSCYSLYFSGGVIESFKRKP